MQFNRVRLFKVGLFAIIMWIAGPALPAQTAADQSGLREQLASILKPYVAAADFLGLIGVKVGNSEPVLVSHGSASVELQVPHRPQNIFMIGSVSKQFTAAAILLLEEDGHLKTTDLVHQHLPSFPHGNKVSIEQLLTHTSGVADIYSLRSFGATGGCKGNFDQVINDLGRMDLQFSPGSSYAYSNGGYSVLAAIIEKVSGLGYGQFLKKRIFEPLGMQNTAHDTPGPVVSGRVPGYDPWGTVKLIPVQPIAEAFSKGSGSLWSSAEDLLKWNKILHNKGLLGPASYEKMVRDYGNGYGFGLSIFKRLGNRTFGHDGRVSGYASDLAYYPEKDVSIVVLSNVQSVVRDEIRQLAAAAVFGKPYTIPERKTYYTGVTQDLEGFAGVYAFGPAFNVTITHSASRLMARANEGGSSELIRLNETEWFSRMLCATVRFGRNADGIVDRLIWGRGEGAPVGRRIK